MGSRRFDRWVLVATRHEGTVGLLLQGAFDGQEPAFGVDVLPSQSQDFALP
jgi:hypothetical protein